MGTPIQTLGNPMSVDALAHLALHLLQPPLTPNKKFEIFVAHPHIDYCKKNSYFNIKTCDF